MMTFPSAALFAAVGSVTKAMASLKQERNLTRARPSFCSLDDYYELVGLERQQRSELDYLDAARSIMNRSRREK